MKKHLLSFISFRCGMLLLLSSCSVDWTKAISYGSIEQADFTETIDVDITNGVMILICKMNGKDYRFLFDTGAPFSISQELQDIYQFKTVSKGTLIDTDRNKIKINYVTVDDISLGDISFINQTAIVLDLKKVLQLNACKLMVSSVLI
jgi:hypothetical protein